MAYHLNVIIDNELHDALDQYIADSKVAAASRSEAVRNLLRYALKLGNARSRGYIEGKSAGYAAAKRAIATAIADLPEEPK